MTINRRLDSKINQINFFLLKTNKKQNKQKNNKDKISISTEFSSLSFKKAFLMDQNTKIFLKDN